MGGYSVGQVAGFAKVTVRTLHHYDEIGLLAPSERSPAGHRRYADADLDRLQRILFYRQLGFPLEEITVLIDDPDTDPMEHLRRQHRLLTERIERLREMAAAVERAMEARKMGIQLTPEERFEVFGENDPEQYAEEAEQRWGSTEAWRESRRRSAMYDKEDWLRIKAEADSLNQRFADLMVAGEEPGGEAAMDLAEEHRQYMCRYFYDCGYRMHRCLAEMYVSDPRYTASYDDAMDRPGLAAYVREAMLANADRHEGHEGESA